MMGLFRDERGKQFCPTEGLLENETEMVSDLSISEASLFSLAISVKRIADALCGSNRPLSDQDLDRLLANMRGKAADHFKDKDF